MSNQKSLGGEFFRKQDVFAIYGPSLIPEGKIFYPADDQGFDDLGDALTDLKGTDNTVVLVDGAFDVPHENHDWYLRHVRALAAHLHIKRMGFPLERDFVKDVVASDAARVLVTVDADAKVSAKKGSIPDKGGAPRPIYTWQARAERIAGLSFHSQTGIRNVVDLVTVEGEPDHKGTILESSLTLASFMTRKALLDSIVMYGEHKETIVEACRLGLQPMVIENHTDYAIDARTGEAWSSSDLIRRAKQG